MTFGFLSMLAAINYNFTLAAWFLICAIACDMLDGRIARMTKTTSEFGVQLDSLSDLVSFGIAPAVMIYMLSLKHMGKIGIAIAVLYILCAALRLAKFNVKAKDGSVHTSFSGLPTPAAAGLLISFVLSFELLDTGGQDLTFKTIPLLMKTMPTFFKAMPIVMVLLSLLMVSNIPFASFKKTRLSRPKALQFLVLILVMVALVIVYPQNTFFILFSLYVISGIIIYVSKYARRLKNFRIKREKNENAR